MGFEVIRNKLKSKLESVDSVQEVHSYPTQEFGGFPAAVIRSERMESEYETTKENERVYIFSVDLYQEVEHQGRKKAREIIESTIDDIIETLDEDQLLTGIQDDLPSQETMIITFPVMNEIIESEKYTIAQLEIRVVISFSIS